MNTEFIGNKDDSVTVSASIMIGEKEIVLGVNIPKILFYKTFAEVCEAVLDSMLDDGLRGDAEKAAEIAEFVREAGE